MHQEQIAKQLQRRAVPINPSVGAPPAIMQLSTCSESLTLQKILSSLTPWPSVAPYRNWPATGWRTS
eukprot:6187498-Pleurochrysis_carterae.AAC.6